MTTLRINPETIKLFESLGKNITLGARKATFLPYIFIRHEDQPADQFELIYLGTVQEWEDYQRLMEPNISQDVV